METKICNRCHKEKLLSEFSKRNVSLNTYIGRCKQCIKEINSDPLKRQKAAARSRQWIEDHKDEVKILRKTYYDKIRKTDKHREYHRNNSKKKYANDSEFRAYMRNASKKYESSEKGKAKRKEIAKRWFNGMSDDARKAYIKRQSLFARTTLSTQIKTLHDSYISKLLVGCVDKTIPKEIIEAKRLIVKINRVLVERGIRVR